MDYYAIGQRIRKTRKARGLSPEALAEQVGISLTHMSHIETGNTKLSLPVLVKLAEVLDVRTDELLYENREAERGASLAAITAALEHCSTAQLRVVEDTLKALIIALNQHY